jgi:glycosyltransferase involved in cell wall biosynthesis
MRICFLSRRYFPAISGMSVYARNMTRFLSERGHEIVMISQYRQDPKGIGIYGGGPPPRESWMQVHGLRSFGEEKATERTPADFEEDLRQMVETAIEHHRQKPFDVVHAQYAYPNGLAALEISRRLGIPNVVSIQGGDGHWVGQCCRTHKAAMQAVLNHAMSLVIGCESFAKEVQENHGTPSGRFTIIPGATNTGQFYPAKEPGSIRKPVQLLYHGRVDQRKGVFDFIRAGKMLLDEGERVSLLISGIGPDLDDSVLLVNELQIASHVEFMGVASYDDAPQVYQHGDIFVSPTYAEGFSNTILEAMACGLPIVSTKTVGVVDCLRDRENASLVKAGDIGAQASALREMIRNSDYRYAIARNAYEEVMRQYSWPVVAEQLENIYHEIRHQPARHGWRNTFDVSAGVEEADLSCRFRAQPHLL